MRSYRRTPQRRRGGNDGSFWLSFSDLMSSLMVIIILVMFYMIYQYFNMMELNQAELARRQFDLDQAQLELEENQGKLTEAEQQMIAQQILLNAREAELEDAQAVLAHQQTELDRIQDELSAKEAEIASQQAQLNTQQDQINTQQAALDDQQRQIEQLVGMRPRIITSLRDALRSAGISAQVDPANGSIALESDVLFEQGYYDLSERGKRFIDKFLPVYLDVLFSEDYEGYVAEIIVEGHTDSLGTYLDNLELSQRRALAVASYVLSDDYRGITPAQKNKLRAVVTANGRSFSDPVLDDSGREDMDASRRVVFKFRLTDEQMIQQLQDILDRKSVV